MKKSIFGLVLLPLLLPAMAMSQSDSNSVINGDFESGVLTPWNAIRTTVSLDGAFEGAYHARLVATANASARLSQLVQDITPNARYRLSAQIKTTNAIYAYIGIEGHGEVFSRDGSYRNLEIEFETGPNERSVQIYVSAWKQQAGPIPLWITSAL